MRPRFGLLVTALALAIAAIAVPAAGAQAQASAVDPGIAQQLVGTAGNLAFDLTATVTQVVDESGALQAVGTVTGTVTNIATGAVTTVDQALAVPVTAVASAGGGSADVSLSLGPASVDALGQSVALAPIQVSLGSDLLSGVLSQVLGLLGGLGGLVGGLGGSI